MKTFTVTLSDDQVQQLESIHSTRLGRTEQQILDQIVERGIYALQYRSKYNQVKLAREAEDKAAFKEWKKSLK